MTAAWAYGLYLCLGYIGQIIYVIIIGDDRAICHIGYSNLIYNRIVRAVS